MHGNELCVPASAVSGYDDSSDSGVAPSAGDEVEVAVKGRVSRVEGGNVYLTPESANGQPIPQGAKAEGGPMGGGGGGDAMDAMVAGEKERMGYV